MDGVSDAGVVTMITVRSATGSGACPDCGEAAGRVHSRYTRTPTVTVAAIEAAVPMLVQAREMIDGFDTPIRRKQEAALDRWLELATCGLLAPFARGLARDHLAVRTAISAAWSNAQAEGQINKLKLVKRQMYGQGKLDLPQARLIATGQ